MIGTACGSGSVIEELSLSPWSNRAIEQSDRDGIGAVQVQRRTADSQKRQREQQACRRERIKRVYSGQVKAGQTLVVVSSSSPRPGVALGA